MVYGGKRVIDRAIQGILEMVEARAVAGMVWVDIQADAMPGLEALGGNDDRRYIEARNVVLTRLVNDLKFRMHQVPVKDREYNDIRIAWSDDPAICPAAPAGFGLTPAEADEVSSEEISAMMDLLADLAKAKAEEEAGEKHLADAGISAPIPDKTH